MEINKIYQGDCLDVIKTFEDNSIDSIVTDPPYELGFMGKKWDNSGIAYSVPMWKECLRVLKPGGHLLSFSGTRTYHRMAAAIEDAGFEVRDMIEWVYGSGFPKSHNIGKAVKALQETGGSSPRNLRKARMGEDYTPTGQEDYRKGRMFSSEIENDNTKEEINNEYEGWGTALKPAHEPICLARKPLVEKTVAENVLKYGTGGINIDESRVESKPRLTGTLNKGEEIKAEPTFFKGIGTRKIQTGYDEKMLESNLGRFPANLIHDNSEEVRECFPESNSGKGKASTYDKFGGQWGKGKQIRNEDYGDSGNASRFFKSIIYQAKASKKDRNSGCEDLEDTKVKHALHSKSFIGDKEYETNTITKNFHPTVKSVPLMKYLIKMITPKGGVVLDPFAGSGSTLVAAKENNFNFIGIELTEEYIPIIEARTGAEIFK